MLKGVGLEIIKSGSVFAQDQKLSHYMKVCISYIVCLQRLMVYPFKVPPRATLLGKAFNCLFYLPSANIPTAQAIAATLSVIVHLGVQQLVFNIVPDACTPNQANSITCNSFGVQFTSSLVWYV